MNQTHNDKVQSILTAHGLDFQIIKRPLIALDGNDTHVTPYYGLFNGNTNECLNTAKAGYTISQNEDVVGMVLKGIEKYGEKLHVSKAGSINGGRRVFLQLGIEGETIIGGDKITRFITVIDSNDGSTGLSVGIGDFAMHCQNQFFRFYKAGQSKFRHTATIEQKIQELPKLIEVALGQSIKQVELYKKFISTPLTKNLADKLVNSVLGNDRTMAPSELAKLSTRSVNLMDTMYADIDRELGEVGHNVFGLFNGLTRFTTHSQKAPKRTNGREESLIVGSAYSKAMDGFNLLASAVS